MSGSGASNLGYSKLVPNSNVNGSFINKYNSNYSGNFSSNEIPSFGMSGAKINTQAANSYVSSACYKGGSNKKSKKNIKLLKQKIKNITKMYKKMPKKTLKRLRHKLLKRVKKHSSTNKKSHRRHKRGGYSQYLSNVPLTPSYSLGGVQLPANQSALANPPLLNPLANCTNCKDFYSH